MAGGAAWRGDRHAFPNSSARTAHEKARDGEVPGLRSAPRGGASAHLSAFFSSFARVNSTRFGGPSSPALNSVGRSLPGPPLHRVSLCPSILQNPLLSGTSWPSGDSNFVQSHCLGDFDS